MELATEGSRFRAEHDTHRNLVCSSVSYRVFHGTLRRGLDTFEVLGERVWRPNSARKGGMKWSFEGSFATGPQRRQVTVPGACRGACPALLSQPGLTPGPLSSGVSCGARVPLSTPQSWCNEI